MARNKHPEETVNLILETATRLFMKKGYEHTSIQDIIDNLGGLSKGAIYHHFKSKEDILVAVTDRMTEESNKLLGTIRDRTDLNGKEKLRTIFRESLLRPVQDDTAQSPAQVHPTGGGEHQRRDFKHPMGQDARTVESERAAPLQHPAPQEPYQRTVDKEAQHR